MYVIRYVEETFLRLFSQGMLNGTVHTSIGQEASAVGVVNSLNVANDVIFSNHRAHGHFLAYTNNVRGLISEIMGKRSGVCGGIGGSQHIHERNMYTNGIQGGIVPCAVGSAVAEKLKKSNAIVAVFLGDGTMGQGIVYEGFNISALWNLPILFVLEDNSYAQTTPKRLAHSGDLSARAKPYNIRSRSVKAIDVEDVYVAACEAVEYVRKNSSPFFLYVETYRFAPHSKGDEIRSVGEINAHKKEDPILRLARKLDPERIREIHNETTDRVEKIVAELKLEKETSIEVFSRFVD